MQIREVVVSYVIDAGDHKVRARITKPITGKEEFLWEVSHHWVGDDFRARRPAPVAAKTVEEALNQLSAYAAGFSSSMSPEDSPAY